MTRTTAAKTLAALRCPICLDVSSQCTQLSTCGHLFCKPCIKEALHLKRECPVCRTSATHRMIREVAISHISSEEDELPTGRSCLQVESADAPMPVGEGSWACQMCTMVNMEAASRCLACHARQPVKYVGHKSAPPQRHQFIVARRAQREKRASNGTGPASRKRTRHTDEGMSSPMSESADPHREEAEERAASVASLSTGAAVECSSTTGRASEDEVRREEEEEEADEKERADQGSRGFTSAAMASNRVPMRPSHGEPQRAKGGATHACRKRMLEKKLAHAGATMPSATSVTEPLSDATRAHDDWPLVRSLCNSKSGYKNVAYNSSRRLAKPWQAREDDGKSLGMYATAEEAAMAYSKHIGFEAALMLAKVSGPESDLMTSEMTGEEALQAAAREGLTLMPAKVQTSSPYFGVYRISTGPRSYLAKAYDDTGQRINLGCFRTAEEAALERARFQERQRRQWLIEKEAATTVTTACQETGDAPKTTDAPAPAKKKRGRPSNDDKAAAERRRLAAEMRAQAEELLAKAKSLEA